MHSHTWTLSNPALRRYRCECGAYGHALPGRRGIVPFLCQHENARTEGDRSHCGKPAVFVTAIRTQSRCGEHAPAERKSA